METVEEAITFDCAGEALVGVLHRPAQPSRTGVVIVVGGPQYRAGSHRQFVVLARALALSGTAVLRFDCRGMGDSSGAQRNFEHTGDEIATAIDALLAAVPALHRVALWGLCDAASAALLYLHDRSDPRVAGLALLNPWVRSPATLARTHVKHYYLQRLRERDFWAKLMRGGVALQAARGLLGNVRLAFGGGSQAARASQQPFQQRMAAAWAAFDGPLLLMLSADDLTAREYADHAAADPAWQRALQRRPPTRVDIAGADHTCSLPGAQRAVEAATVGWLASAVAA